MSSDKTTALLKTVYDRLLAYVDAEGDKLANHVGSGGAARLYIRQAPDAIQYPYVVMRLSEAAPDPDVGNIRLDFTIEARCVNRAEDGTVEQIADLVEEALLTWQESSAAVGFTRGRTSRRESPEPLTDAPNRDLAEVLVAVTCVSWAVRLTGIAP